MWSNIFPLRLQPLHLFSLAILFSLAVIIFALACSFINGTSDSSYTKGLQAVDTLKFVIVVSRHGNRRLSSFPNDPYPLSDTRFWQYGLGELTNAGRVQMYKLGVKIRELYSGFLNTTYLATEFYASSTKTDRVLQSAGTFLAGLYPPTGFQIWNKDIKWQPIPIYTDSQDKTVEMNLKICPRLQSEQLASLSQFEADQDNVRAIASIGNYLKPFLGENKTDSMTVFGAWDTFISEETEGYTLPSWVDKVYPEPLNTLISKAYLAAFSANDVMARLIMGSFYREMVETLMSKVNGTLSPDMKMFFYSGHDTSLLILQYILGIPKNSIRVVTPGSAMMFELHQNPFSNQYYLQILYIGGASPSLDPVVLFIPNCGTPCDFYCLVSRTAKFYNNTNYETECQLNYS